MEILDGKQKMFIVLSISAGIKEDASGKEECKMEYQIASRIYANAFAGLMRYGYMPEYIERGDMAILTLSLNGKIYECPARTIKNILKTEFTAVEEKHPGLKQLIDAEERRLSAGKKKKKGKDTATTEDETLVLEQHKQKVKEEKDNRTQPVNAKHDTNTTDNMGKTEKIIEKKLSVENKTQKTEAASIPQKTTDNNFYENGPKNITVVPATDSDKTALIEDLLKTIVDNNMNTEEKAASRDTKAPVPSEIKETGNDIEGEAENEKEGKASNESEKDKSIDVDAEDKDQGTQKTDTIHDTEFAPGKDPVHTFQKKEPSSVPMNQDIKQDKPQTSDTAGDSKNIQETAQSEEPAHSIGVLSRFFPKNRNQDIKKKMGSETPSPQTPVLSDTERTSHTEGIAPDIIPEIENEKPGILFCHVHQVTLKKTYGSQVVGPYTIHVWPTEVIELHPNRTPCSIFVRAEAPNGTILTKVSDEHTKYVTLIIDSKQFNIVGSWENGHFLTSVSIINKTASIYTKTEQITSFDPKETEATDAMLDQFRFREPRRPEFFIVPLKNINHGESSIKIAAYARVNNKNFVLSESGNGNSLYFTYANEPASEISGHWEDGQFRFSIDTVKDPE